MSFIDEVVQNQTSTTVIENQKVTLGQIKNALTPSTITAMVGIHSGSALQVSPDVQNVMTQLSTKAASMDYPANVQAAAALASMTSLQGQLLPSGNHAAFGSFLNQINGHINNSNDLQNTVNNISTKDFSDFGSGITNMSSLADQGITGALGNPAGVAKSIASTGTMFAGLSPSNFGSPVGIMQALQNNKLFNVSGASAKLAAAGVDTTNLTDPVYATQIDQVASSINDPTTLNVVAKQFNQNPFSGLPSYNGDDSSLYTNNAFAGGAPSLGSTVEGTVTQGYSTASTAFGASQAPTVGTGGIQSLKDLGDPSKLASPSDITGVAGASDIAGKFGDMNANFSDLTKTSGILSQIKMPSIPSLDSFAPSLGSLMSSHASVLNSMTGVSLGSVLSPNTGNNGLPSITDFTQHLTGGPATTDILTNGVNTTTLANLTASISKSSSLFSTAGIDLSSPPLPGMSSSMNFATSLHQFGQNSEISGLLGNMAVPNNPFGDSIKASLTEGKNNALLSKMNIHPPSFNNLPSYTGQDASVNNPASFITGS